MNRSEEVPPDVAEAFVELCYPDVWWTSGLLTREFLLRQVQSMSDDSDWAIPHRAHRVHDIGTEHYRVAAISQAFHDPRRVLSGEKLAALLDALFLDPDPTMAGGFVYSLLSDASPLTPSLQLAVARHRVIMRSSGAIERAVALQVAAGRARSDCIRDIVALLPEADPWHHHELVRALREPAIHEWFALHGVNNRVRKYAKHGLCLRGKVTTTSG